MEKRTRLYSLTPEHVTKLEAIAKYKRMHAGQCLRELVEVEWVKMQQALNPVDITDVD